MTPRSEYISRLSKEGGDDSNSHNDQLASLKAEGECDGWKITFPEEQQ